MRVLIQNPNFIILDEPTNDLDIDTLSTLENFLINYTGCLIIVSHDRYFMDRIIDHLFVFEGKGKIKNFPGSYTDYRDWRELEDQKLMVKNAPSKPELIEQKEKPKKKKSKLSFKEQYELETIEKELGTLSKRKKEIEEKLGQLSTEFEEITMLGLDLEMLQDELDEKEIRWLELEELRTAP